MASRLQDVIQRGTSAARPAATTVAPGTVYYSTDLSTTDRSDGTTWQTIADIAAATVIRRQVTVVIDGGGSAITTGVKAYLSLPLAGTWKKWRVLSIDPAATPGSIVLDVWKDTYTNYPPTVADTITASAKPTLSSVNKNESSTLTGWTTAFTAGDVIGVNVDSATTVTKVQLVLEFE
jgi:hypothetical protein